MKCCDNCKHRKAELDPKYCKYIITANGVETSVFSCIKWEKKEEDEFFESIKLYSRSTGGAGEIMNLFKQRIEESVNRAISHDLNRMVHISNVEKAFDWILDEHLG